MTKKFNYSRDEVTAYRGYVVALLPEAVQCLPPNPSGDVQATLVAASCIAANVADSLVYLERTRFESDPQPTAYVLETPVLDEPPITPRSEQREAIDAEKARIDAGLRGGAFEEAVHPEGRALRSMVGPRVAADLQPEPAPVPEVEP